YLPSVPVSLHPQPAPHPPPRRSSDLCGKASIELAKMTGITPPALTRKGRCVDCPPITLRPTTRLAYCTGILRSARSTNTMNATTDRKSTRLNSSHGSISYAVIFLNKNNSRERSGSNTILHELNPLFTIQVKMRDIKRKKAKSSVKSKATTHRSKTETATAAKLTAD